jgi:hypothetical protein
MLASETSFQLAGYLLVVLDSMLVITLAEGIRIDSSKGLFTPSMREMASVWQETLLDLVALEDGDTGRFWRRRWYFRERPNDAKLRYYRDFLRQYWSGDRDFLPAILSELVYDAQRKDHKPLRVESQSQALYQIVPDFRIFVLSLAFAVNHFQSRLAVCENPECRDYFVKPRKTQKFCDRPNCLIYGQQKQKREWWKKHGDEWRKQRANRKNRGKKPKR